ncbi:MAG: hypothetical protein GY774_30530 [Planctomycetes bacterium]|nr:hypothetical protein [Planctomycetota bacterium]
MNLSNAVTMNYKIFPAHRAAKTSPVLSAVEWANEIQSQNAVAAGRIKFLLLFFLNLMVGYVDKNV